MEKLRLLLEAHAASGSPDELGLTGHGGIRFTLGDLKEVYGLAQVGQNAAQRDTVPAPEPDPPGSRPGHRAPAGARRSVA